MCWIAITILSVRFSSRHSLLRHRVFVVGFRKDFQSAFHRGIHCYRDETKRKHQLADLSVRFSSRHSLLHVIKGLPEARRCLSVRFSSRHSLLRADRVLARSGLGLSVRFSSRHSLLLHVLLEVRLILMNFQSAFHRGIHCYCRINHDIEVQTAFSPLFIAAFTATIEEMPLLDIIETFSPLFIAAFTATWESEWQVKRYCPFSPLFIAAFTATPASWNVSFGKIELSVRFSSRHSLLLVSPVVLSTDCPLSVRFSSRHSLLLAEHGSAKRHRAIFQSAFHRGIHCYTQSRRKSLTHNMLSVRFSSRHSLLLNHAPINVRYFFPFSPLFIAAFTATQTSPVIQPAGKRNFQSAFHRGIHCYVGMVIRMHDILAFQSAFHRGIHCYFGGITSRSPCLSLSVRFSSRHSLLRGGADARMPPLANFQSAFHRGIHCYCVHRSGRAEFTGDFQSAFHRGIHCYVGRRFEG